jgi:hypothetical protein
MFEIGAGPEAAAFAGQHDDTHVFALRDRFQAIVRLDEHLVRHAVHPVGPVYQQPTNPVGRLEF